MKVSNRVLHAFTALLVASAVAWTAREVSVYVGRADLSPTQPWRLIPDWRTYATRGHRVSTAQEPVSVIVFSDYLCGACKNLHRRLVPLMERYAGRLTIVIRHLPLSEVATEAAKAAVCASYVGRFRELNEALFSSSDVIGVEPWSTLAMSAGLRDTLQLHSCMHGPRAARDVTADLMAVEALGSSRTPTILIEDELYAGLPWDFDAIVARDVAVRGKRVPAQ